MLLGRNVSINVFKIDDDGTFDCIAEIDEITSMIWPQELIGFATVEINANLTDSVKEFLVPGNFIWAGGDSAAEIFYAAKDIDEYGNETYKVKANTLEYLLRRRIVWNSYNCNNIDASEAMLQLVNQNAISPTNKSRKIKYMEAGDVPLSGKRITYQVTGEQLDEALSDICETAGTGYKVEFDPIGKKFIFKVIIGEDKTLSSDSDNCIVISTDYEDLLGSSYEYNSQDFRNVALVAGESLIEGQESPRKTQVSGANELEGFKRYETYVDASDLQSKTKDADGNDVTLTDTEYNAALIQRGDDNLANMKVSESFDASIRTFGKTIYKFGEDYYIGDKITAVDNRLNVKVDAVVMSYQEEYDDDYSISVVFGYGSPTLMKKIRKKIY